MNRSRTCAIAWIWGLLAIAACRPSSATEEKPSPAGGATEQISIYVGRDAPALEQYAARELQRYLYQLSGSLPKIRTGVTAVDAAGFVLGRRKTNPLIEKLAAAGQVKVSDADPGPQGYVLKRLAVGDKEVVVVAGSDERGCLYGVYGLLEEHYGIGFYLCGDVLPDRKAPLRLAHVDERKAPAAAIRGFLPWTNFPQSATVYSWEDWRFIIDQMAKMRMNFLHIHNYNETGLLPRVSPVPRHNEMFHNFTYRGITSRVWMATVRTGHFWWGPPWDLAQYRFGAGDLFDDYDFGADCTLHNEGLSNEEVFRKGASEFQKILAHAHARGVKVGLGLDINVLPEDYKAKADDPGVVAARAEQIVRDYPDLDYLLCFQAEDTGSDPAKWASWRRTVMGFYEKLKARSPATRLAVAGWGLNPASIAQLPADVIVLADCGLLGRLRQRGGVWRPRVLGLPLAGTGRRQLGVLRHVQGPSLEHDQGLAAARGEHERVLLPHVARGGRRRSEDILRRQGPLGPGRQVRFVTGRVSRVCGRQLRRERGRPDRGDHRPE